MRSPIWLRLISEVPPAIDSPRCISTNELEMAASPTMKAASGPASAVEIAAAGLAVYLECGDDDMFDLHHGTEALHRRMFDIGLSHEYRSVRGADHIGRTVGPRIVDALPFLGRALREAEPDREPDREVAAVVHALTNEPVTLAGHAFGNRVARMTATEFPHLVERVVLLCCGGLIPAAPEPAAALVRVFDGELSDDEHLAAVATAFFAPGNDASVWSDGWHPTVAAAQAAATTRQPVAHWWGGGGKDLLVVQPVDDVLAVPENARRICEEFGDRATMVTVDRA